MGQAMRQLFRRHPVAMGVLTLSLVLTLVFALRLAAGAIYWSGHVREPVQPWMTVGYVGKSWDLDPREIDRIAGLPLPMGRPMTLQEIARDRGVPVADVIAAVEAAVADLQARTGGGQE
jgi:hypothetical protein